MASVYVDLIIEKLKRKEISTSYENLTSEILNKIFILTWLEKGYKIDLKQGDWSTNNLFEFQHQSHEYQLVFTDKVATLIVSINHGRQN